MQEKYFDIKRDMAQIRNGTHFMCHGCLVSRPFDDQSPDPRYCLSCYAVLMDEASRLPETKHPRWVPKADKALSTAENKTEKAIPVPQGTVLNMSTIKGENSEVDIIPPAVATRPLSKRGPKFTELPEDLIRQLAGEGMGSKAIAARILKDKRIVVSYKTIQRRLQGSLL
jgi:hypothetical protein